VEYPAGTGLHFRMPFSKFDVNAATGGVRAKIRHVSTQR
jgi:hypothetical protein